MSLKLHVSTLLLVAGFSTASYGLTIPAAADASVNRATTAIDTPDNGETLNLAYNGTNGRVLRTSHIQFALGTEAATQASLNVYGVTLPGNAYPGANVNGEVYGKVGSFDEATLTWRIMWGGDVNPDWTGWTYLGDLHDLADMQQNNIYGSMDITAFYNAHLGETVHIAMRNTTPTNSTVVKFASKESTLGNVGPYLDVVPEPVSLLLLAVGMALVPRRTRK